MNDTFIPFHRPSIGEEEISEVVDTLRSGWLTTGPRATRFEGAFCEHVGAGHAVAVNSATAALHLALVALGIGPADEVITTPMTFCATVQAILHVGATPRSGRYRMRRQHRPARNRETHHPPYAGDHTSTSSRTAVRDERHLGAGPAAGHTRDRRRRACRRSML
jgi:hypothetical protein